MSNPFRSLAQKTVHTLDGEEVNRLFHEVSGWGMRLVGEFGSCGVVSVEVGAVPVAEHERAAYDACLRTGYGYAPTILRVFLADLCACGDIPAGAYQLTYDRVG